MAELSAEDRQRVWRGLMRYWSNARSIIGADKTELQTTANETDTWINDNQASYVSSLTYGGQFNATQLTLIFCAVALARVGITALRCLLGEVD